MKKIIYILLVLSFKLSFTQSIRLSSLEFETLQFYGSKKSKIEKQLGKPNKTYKYQYKCEYDEDLIEERLIIEYDAITFFDVGAVKSDEPIFRILKINFENSNDVILKYNSYELNNKTNLKDLIKIFGNQILKYYDHENESLHINNYDIEDWLEFKFKNEKLVCIEYKSPC